MPLTVAFTFDTDLSRTTAAILDALAPADDHATFFVLGQQIAGREALLRWIGRDGHEIGIRGWDETRWTRQHQVEQIRRSLRRTLDLIEDETDVRPTLWRPPGHELAAPAMKAAEMLELRLAPAAVDAHDDTLDAHEIYQTLRPQLRHGSCFRFRDGHTTCEAVAALLEHCHSATLSGLAQVKA